MPAAGVPPPGPEPPPGPASTEAELLFALVCQRYGSRLTPAQLDEVRKGVEAAVETARLLRAVRVPNGEPPAVPCRADAWP